MKVGDICFLKEASISSMQVYNTYKAKGLKLVCPCSIKASEELEVIEIINNNLILVCFKKNKNKIVMIRASDLRK